MTTLLVVPLDGSRNSMQSLRFLKDRFGPDNDLKIALLHVLPALPSVLIEEGENDPETKKKIEAFHAKNSQTAKKMMLGAKERLIEMGYSGKRVDTVLENNVIGIARDICTWVKDQHATAIVITSTGHSEFGGFFIGEIASKIAQFCRSAPTFLIKGKDGGPNALLAIDDSENALRAAEFAGSILAGTTCRLSLFHSRRPLSHHIDGALIDNFPALEAHWERTSGESIGATIQKAREKLVAAGLPEAHLTIQIVDGSSNVSDDILDAAEKADAGLIIIGCKGHTNAIEYSIGSTANRVVHKAENMAVCLVP